MYDRLRMAPDPGYRDLESQRHPPPDTFHDEDDDPDAFLYDANQTPTHPGQSPEMMASPVARHSRPRKQARDQIGLDDDEDVPASLLLDPGKRGISRAAAGKQPDAKLAKAEAQWQAMQEQQRLHMSQAPRSTRPGSRPSRVTAPHTQPARADPRNEAMWMYTNAGNLDSFLLEVYQYYTGHGVWSILLSRILGLLSELFMFRYVIEACRALHDGQGIGHVLESADSIALLASPCFSLPASITPRFQQADQLRKS